MERRKSPPKKKKKKKTHCYIPWAFFRADTYHSYKPYQICKSASFSHLISVSKLLSAYLGHSLLHPPSPVCLWWTRRWWTTSLWSWEWRDTLRRCATSCWWRTASLHSPSAICSLKRWRSFRNADVGGADSGQIGRHMVVSLSLSCSRQEQKGHRARSHGLVSMVETLNLNCVSPFSQTIGPVSPLTCSDTRNGKVWLPHVWAMTAVQFAIRSHTTLACHSMENAWKM